MHQITMYRIVTKLASVIVAGTLLGTTLPAHADIGLDRAEGIAWLLQQQNGDGSWGKDGARVVTTGEVLEALRLSGVERGFLYSRGLSWIANVRTDSVDSLARKIIALERAGFDAVAMGMLDDLLARRNTRLGWGSFDGYASGFPDTALAVQAIYAANYTYPEMGTTIARMVQAQKPGDFGWSYMSHNLDGGSKSLIMPTAYNLMALSDHLQAGGGGTSQATRGVRWLLQSKRQANGSFLDDVGVTTGEVQQTALAWLAIEAVSAAGIVPVDSADALADARAYLLSRQMADGSWNNDALHTAFALRTFPAVAMPDADDDGVPDDVEALLGTDPNASDVRELIAGNGLDPEGMESSSLNAEAIILEATQGQAFSFTPALSGGVPVYNWKINGGALPVGVTLQSVETGELVGTPALVGMSSFSLRVTDSSGAERIVPGSIRILAADDQIIDTDGDGLWSSFEIAIGSDPMDAGSKLAPGAIDSDGDGLPDTWEQANGQDHSNAGDAQLDSDGDSWSNIREYQQGTDPQVSNKPQLVNDYISLDEDSSVNFNVLSNDSGDLVLSSLNVSSQTSNGALVSSGAGNFTYTPQANLFGSDGFNYRICGANGLCATAPVNINIVPVNDPPTVSLGTDKMVGSIVNVSLNSSVSDLDGSVVTYAWTQIGGVTVSLSGADSDTVSLLTPDLGYQHELGFELVVIDNEGGSASDQLIVTVTAGLDSDGDGVLDDKDDFPFDPSEWLDTDGDGIGNNADVDDDADGMSDLAEIDNGRNPLVNEAVLIVIISSLSN